ncbi:MAG: hypothetical protein ABW185_02575 [Sedimenticola sp.]
MSFDNSCKQFYALCIIPDYDWGSGQFSTWTESAWAADAMDVRLFLIPSKKFEVC